MTDTVTLPVERAEYERLISVTEGLINEVSDPGTEALAAVWCARRILDTAAIHVAAPKAKPVSDPYKLGWQPIEDAPQDGTVIDVWREEGGRDTVFWGLPYHECGEMGRYCDDDWHSIRAPGWVCNTFNELIGRTHNPFTHWKPVDAGPHAQPEAQKGEQEPVGQIVNASSVTPINQNEVQWSDGRMPKVGTKLYPHPAPSSELLSFPYQQTFNAIADAVTWQPNKSFGISVEAFERSFNAKHKGPQ